MNLRQSYFADFVSLIFPELCQACAKSLYRNEELICADCLYHLPYTDFHLNADNAVAQQFWGRVPLEAAAALLYFTKGSRVQNLMHQLKYKNKPEVGVYLGKLAGKRLLENPIFTSADMIIPVPLHKQKLLKRGYNQSLSFAEGLSEKLSIQAEVDNLVRITGTESQTKKSRTSRYENMKDVFSVKKPEKLADKHILLVDDIITTGATLEACCNVLLEIPGVKISLTAIAYTA
ncbi:ComF family protein [Mucilaginibacter arboris]|uniref:ComF family protein n=1 Tax=Mucilaginibacter arboris TaxID=2682090 RepID=A0A7K1SRX4_9SPHI|nr:phosphoribosyltransferase family protein [Mucilaginibacter arboris]MVN19977.1 ComF family protein [Mucilaginibacter arboris]